MRQCLITNDELSEEVSLFCTEREDKIIVLAQKVALQSSHTHTQIHTNTPGNSADRKSGSVTSYIGPMCEGPFDLGGIGASEAERSRWEHISSTSGPSARSSTHGSHSGKIMSGGGRSSGCTFGVTMEVNGSI